MDNQLHTVVESLRLKLSKYAVALKRNETLVRYILVDPVLRTFGWNTDDPELVFVEYNVTHDRLKGPSVDYALMAGSDKPLVFVEVKTLGGNLTRARQQCKTAIDLCKHGRVSLFILTDGQKYESYELMNQETRKTGDCDIGRGEPSQVVQDLHRLVGKPESMTRRAASS